MRRTLKQIAADLEVSPMSVSRALRGAAGVSPELRARIREYAEQVNYQPDMVARSLVARSAKAFGIIVPNLRHSFWLEMVIGVERVARAAGWQVILAHAADDACIERDEVWALVGRRIGALLIASCDPDGNADVMRDVEACGVPVVLFDRFGTRRPGPGVYADDRGGARLATRHLVDLGYERIAHLAGDLRYSPAQDRLAGYREVVEARGLAPIVMEAGFGEENGYRGMQRLLDAEEVDAVFVSHDPSAIGALRAALDRRLRVPEDIAIVGFANMDCAGHVAVPLTTVSQPKEELGEALAGLAMRCVAEDVDASVCIVLPTHLVVRRSCGAHLRRGEAVVRALSPKGGAP